MGRIIVTNHVTLDGVMQGPATPEEDTRDGFEHGGWGIPGNDEVMAREMSKGMAAGGPLLLGRRTYEAFYGYWPHQTDNPYTDVLNRATKYVASTTLSDPLPWSNSTLLEGDAGEAVARLKEQESRDIGVLGSGDLIQTLREHDLVDEYKLLIHPLVLGAGRRLFAEGPPPAGLRLTDSVTTTTGVVIATYERAR
jgi:dihydrofolate reductase